MCSKSKINDALMGGSGTSGGAVLVPSIAAHQVRQNRDAFFLVDIREPLEVTTKPWSDADAAVPMGALCHDATDVLVQGNNKTLVLVCNTGVRANLAAQCLLSAGAGPQKVAVLQRGLLGWENPAGLSPDFVVVFGLGDSREKLSLALAAASAAVEMHSTVVLVLMSDGVNWFLKPDSPAQRVSETPHVETVAVGEPFKPCKAMLHKFLSGGGAILGCTTCVLHRGYSFDADLMECVKPMQMPDLVRMLGEAKGGSLQFM